MPVQQTQIRASTQDHLNIKNIQEGLVILKNGSCCLVLRTTAINFGLLSEREQEAIIYAYAGFLNSLTFPIQIVIISRQKDISSYLALINHKIQFQKEGKLREQMKKYRLFIENIVQKNKVLDKRFYIVIPFSPLSVTNLSQKDLIDKAKTDLYPKRDHILGQFQRLGLKVLSLNNQELIELFYNIYNPEAEGQKFVLPEEYSASFVQTRTQPAPVSQPKPNPVPMPNPKYTANPAPQEQPALIYPQRYTPTPILPKPVNQPLVGQKLQDKINNIVQGVAQKQRNKNAL